MVTIKPQTLLKSTVFLCLMSTILVLPGLIHLWETRQRKANVISFSESDRTIQQLAASITVKIVTTEALGSGIIWANQDSSYLVITNKHVLRAGKFPYQIQTADGQIHYARVLDNSQLDKYDLAILKFNSAENSYQTATIGNFKNLTVGEPVIAVGFPYNREDLNHNLPRSPKIPSGLDFKMGRISFILDRSLEEGYQIGYTSDVKKGMSGGPLLNHRGEVVGINGKHAYPLWDAPDFYEDGSSPCPPLQKLITRSSLAIPLQKIVRLTLPSTFLPNYEYDNYKSFKSNRKPIIVNLERDTHTQKSIDKMQAEAELRKSCQEISEDSDLSEVN